MPKIWTWDGWDAGGGRERRRWVLSRRGIANKIEFYVAAQPDTFRGASSALGVLYHFISVRVALPRRARRRYGA